MRVEFEKKEQEAFVEDARKIVLGMSGGVDSATSAIYLMRAGYEVIGCTALFLDDEHSRQSAKEAEAVCKSLGIVHITRDCTALFEREVVKPFVEDYAHGLTPSPCVQCNARAKIPALFEVARELACEKVATGHYARIDSLAHNGRYIVKTALDQSKDQSYMLSQLSQAQLKSLVLPLGSSTKVEVRALAKEAGLEVAHKEDSQDICFIDGKYPDFLRARGLIEKEGSIVDRSGKVLGKHAGLSSLTVGQRKGIGVAAAEPYYVLDKRFETNELVVGFKEESFINGVVVHKLNWQAIECLGNPLECTVKLRYRSRAVPCVVEPCAIGSDTDSATVVVSFSNPQASTASGQVAVFYQGEEVLGGGVIREVHCVS
ncbi:MAG: tRNA 2-thiouridine(34) synthase MnmA [Raoultibacter sp.]